MLTIMDKEKNRYLKRFHTLLSKVDGDKDMIKETILDSFGVQSSRDLNAHELLEACAALEGELSPRTADYDKWRKRLIGAIGGWLKAMNKESNIDLIKAIACRAAGVDNFNRIPIERLRSLYHAFRNKQKDLRFVDGVTREELDFLIAMN
ncbi:hypothetical protein [Maribellus mangrovi]|uniref:hypothetical protein n=1 Tax=Maribellus mangrovi TaxID=3133146 RepID=UPI0030EB2276